MTSLSENLDTSRSGHRIPGHTQINFEEVAVSVLESILGCQVITCSITYPTRKDSFGEY